jgi:hypothetical protein
MVLLLGYLLLEPKAASSRIRFPFYDPRAACGHLDESFSQLSNPSSHCSNSSIVLHIAQLVKGTCKCLAVLAATWSHAGSD